MESHFQHFPILLCFSIYITFIISLSLTEMVPKCRHSTNLMETCPSDQKIGIVYEAVLFADILNYTKPAKRFQLCDDQIGVNAINCSMGNGNKRSIELPGNHDQNMLKMAFNDETVNGALLMDYLGSWVLSLDFMPESKECVNVEHGECQLECLPNGTIKVAKRTTTTQMLTTTTPDPIVFEKCLHDDSVTECYNAGNVKYDFLHNHTCNWDPSFFKPNIYDKVIYGRPPSTFDIQIWQEEKKEKFVVGIIGKCFLSSVSIEDVFIPAAGASISDLGIIRVSCGLGMSGTTIHIECQDCNGTKTHCPSPSG